MALEKSSTPWNSLLIVIGLTLAAELGLLFEYHSLDASRLEFARRRQTRRSRADDAYWRIRLLRWPSLCG